ncbi:SLC13 family permease [Aquisalibacillus elongatus]|uniref:Di/tricarboxylate transporter n=1 Tax=Aquisalibacillus elongatus TaxID=485577 RepID=A0A3N5B9X4_9BACI|nr:SLC13 family permease [Aquisalibacillus elongatus]RPF54187.1 di/tricarboxylate transporter [Aquisalibacillus elongatus]
MTFEMVFVLIVVLAMLVGLLFEVARPDMVVFSALTILLIAGILTPQEALKGFSNEGMLTIALLFVVAGAVKKSGIIDRLIQKWLQNTSTMAGMSGKFFAPLSFFSAFLNNTPIVVTFTPVLRKWCQDKGIAPSKLLIPLSYVTILGGTMTLMGTSTNLVVHGMLKELGFDGFSFFQLAIVGVPITLVGLIYLTTIAPKILPSYKSFQDKMKENTREYMAELTVGNDFPHVNQTVKKAGLRDLKGLFLIEIIRNNEIVSPVGSNTIIRPGDRLIFTGLISTIADLEKMKGLYLETGTHLRLEDLKSGNGETQLLEAVVSHDSSLLSKTIKQSHFRSKYDAGVIAVHRNNERIKSKIGDIVLKPGDTLLLLTGADFIDKHQYSNDFYVISSLGTPKELNEDPVKGWFSIAVLVSMVVLVALGILSMFKAMLLAVLILFIGKAITPEEAKGYIQFHVLLLIASAIGVGAAMTETGLAQLMAQEALNLIEPFGMVAVILLVYLLTNIFTELITNAAAAVLMLPIGIEMANQLNIDPMGLAITIAIAASASFVTPIGYQTNLIVYGPGGYKFSDYIKVGLPLSLIVMIVTTFIITQTWV